MKELFHHFGLLDNRVQVGMTGHKKSTDSHGVVIGTKWNNNQRERVNFVVDDPKKLKSPSTGMVADMVKQIGRLGVYVDVIELHAHNTVFTYQALPDNRVQLLTKVPRHI